MSSILGLATAVPANYYHQNDICEKFIQLQTSNKRRDQAIRKIFELSGITHRHMVINETYFDQQKSTKERNDTYIDMAIPLGEETIKKLLDSTGYSAQDIDDFIVVSCTGFTIPGLDLHLAGRLKMRSNLRRTCILGMGCYAAFPALLRAAQSTNNLTLVLCVELCSLHLQFDTSAENVVSSALFSDGAAAVLIGSKNTAKVLPTILHSQTECNYQTLDHMSFNVTDTGFKMQLSSYVPDLLAQNITHFVDTMLHEKGLTKEAIKFWGIHPGSKKIVEHIQEQLSLSDEQTACSYDILNRYGNMSSATILFVLDAINEQGQHTSGDKGVLLAFGPGLTMEGIILEWR